MSEMKYKFACEVSRGEMICGSVEMSALRLHLDIMFEYHTYKPGISV